MLEVNTNLECSEFITYEYYMLFRGACGEGDVGINWVGRARDFSLECHGLDHRISQPPWTGWVGVSVSWSAETEVIGLSTLFLCDSM